MILNASITQGDTVWLVRLILMDKNMILTNLATLPLF